MIVMNFNPLKSIAKDDPMYIRNPSLKDRVHCLVSVLPADKITMITDDFHKMKTVREKARALGIPQVVIMSLVDRACPLVNKDLMNIYTSRKIKDKNYHEQITNDLHMDLLILMAITNIITFANKYVEDQVYNVNEHVEKQLYSE